MRIREWVAVWVVSVAVPAQACGPADTASTAAVTMDIVGTRWVGTYQVMGKTYTAGLIGGNLRVGRFGWRFRLVPGREPSGPCEILGPGFGLRAIYRLERGRLLICSGTTAPGPRPRAFRVTPQSDLWIFRPVSGK